MDKKISPPAPPPAPGNPPEHPVPDVGSVRDQDAQLDEELDETFPASDPVLWRHGH